MCSSYAKRSWANVCNPELIFKDEHPYLVGLPPPDPTRLFLVVSKRFTSSDYASAGLALLEGWPYL